MTHAEIPPPPTENTTWSVERYCLLFLCTVAAAGALYLLRQVFMPFCLAILLTYCLIPLIDFQIRRLRLPRTLAFAATALLVIMALGIVWGILAATVSQISANADMYLRQMEGMRDRLIASLPLEELGLHVEPDDTERFTVSKAALTSQLGALVGALVSFFSNGAMVLVFTLFMLSGRVSHGIPEHGVWRDVETQITHFLFVKVVVSVTTGALVWLSLALLGIQPALAFGFLAFLLNFIPSIGSVAATLLPLPVVLFNPDVSPVVKVLAIAIPGSIQISVGNIIEPRMMGKSLNLHPITILVALMFFGMLWGIVGMILATPLTVVIKIICERHDGMLWLARLFEGTLSTGEPAAT
jgi:AI-2 transport protein TqsA